MCNIACYYLSVCWLRQFFSAIFGKSWLKSTQRIQQLGHDGHYTMKSPSVQPLPCLRWAALSLVDVLAFFGTFSFECGRKSPLVFSREY